MHRLNFAPVDCMPSYLRLSTVVAVYQSDFRAKNIALVCLLGQQATTQPHAERNRNTDSIAGSDHSSDTDTESDSLLGLSDAHLDPCEPPLTEILGGRPQKKRMPKYEAHAQRNKRLKEGQDQVPDRAPRRCGVGGVTDGHNARPCTRIHMERDYVASNRNHHQQSITVPTLALCCGILGNSKIQWYPALFMFGFVLAPMSMLLTAHSSSTDEEAASLTKRIEK
ncbi:hypothetical protein FN846DRAFT_885724 [Sphaerosporella brunnea]|uniref:Uncharacterized protein n=1 Tax=Sphaerosporella brunnea TaxID=1250544 RepID=A0A5J5FBR2_9PEZI|nr:hypothetical protein FN846DRAFT_885724 [Sphaerosporella brunnea]